MVSRSHSLSGWRELFIVEGSIAFDSLIISLILG